MIIPFYDEFGIYTTREDIEIFIENIINSGETNKEFVFNKCVEIFGEYLSNIIDDILFYED